MLFKKDISLTSLLTRPVLMCSPAADADAVVCSWTESTEIVLSRRRAFCRSVEGFVDVCRCRDPSPIVFSPAMVSVTVLAVNRRTVSHRQLRCGGSSPLWGTELVRVKPN